MSKHAVVRMKMCKFFKNYSVYDCFKKYIGPRLYNGGTLERSWLMHCATSLKIAGSIPDGVFEIFSLT